MTYVATAVGAPVSRPPVRRPAWRIPEAPPGSSHARSPRPVPLQHRHRHATSLRAGKQERRVTGRVDAKRVGRRPATTGPVHNAGRPLVPTAPSPWCVRPSWAGPGRSSVLAVAGASGSVQPRCAPSVPIAPPRGFRLTAACRNAPLICSLPGKSGNPLLGSSNHGWKTCCD